MEKARKLYLMLVGVVIVTILGYANQTDVFNLVMDIFGTDTPKDGVFPTLKSYKCDGKWTKIYQEMHKKSLSPSNKDRKFLIYHCTGHGHTGGCGGYGNRMAGLISTFYLAVLMNRTFMIHWGGPELIDTYLKPNRINWRYDTQALSGLRARFTYWGLERVPKCNRYQQFYRETTFLNWIQHLDFEKYFALPVEKISTMWYFGEKLWDNEHLRRRAMHLGFPLRNSDHPNGMMGCAMRFLFTKSKSIRRDLEKAKATLRYINRPMIGIHIRTSDHHFGSYNPASYRTRDPNRVFSCAQKVEKVLKRKNPMLKHKTFTWFLATDKKKLKDEALKSYPDNVVTFNFVPQHLDLQNKGFQQTLRDILLDQLMLMECDYFIATGASTFSTMVIGTRQFLAKSIVYGEKCELNENIVALSPPHVNTE